MRQQEIQRRYERKENGELDGIKKHDYPPDIRKIQNVLSCSDPDSARRLQETHQLAALLGPEISNDLRLQNNRTPFDDARQIAEEHGGTSYNYRPFHQTVNG